MAARVALLASLLTLSYSQEDTCQGEDLDAVELMQKRSNVQTVNVQGGEAAFRPELACPDKKKCDSKHVAHSPADYKKCWDEKRHCCVSPDLYGQVNSKELPDPLYFAGAYQWITSSDNLETMLELRKAFGDHPKVSLGVQGLVGFNPIAVWGEDEDALLVFQFKDESVKASAVPPTWATWFHLFQEQAPGVEFAYDVVKELLDAYVEIGDDDVVSAWVKLTHCSRECSVPNYGSGPNVTEECGCLSNVVHVHNALTDYRNANPYDGLCIQKLFKITKGKPTAGQVRAAFNVCENMLPIHTGFGLGYNTIVNPLKTVKSGHLACFLNVSERLAGRELVLPNMGLNDTAVVDGPNASVEIVLPGVPSEEWIAENAVSRFC